MVVSFIMGVEYDDGVVTTPIFFIMAKSHFFSGPSFFQPLNIPYAEFRAQ